MKNSFSTFEILLSIIISSIVVVYSMLFIKESYFENRNLQNIEILKLDMLSTKSFLQKHKDFYENLNYSNDTLYFENSILLQNVKEFQLTKNSQIIEININLNDKIKQTWKFKR